MRWPITSSGRELRLVVTEQNGLRQFSHVFGILFLIPQYVGSEIYTYAWHKKPGVFPLFCLLTSNMQDLRKNCVLGVKGLVRFSVHSLRKVFVLRNTLHMLADMHVHP
jgi:hypothetical protein